MLLTRRNGHLVSVLEADLENADIVLSEIARVIEADARTIDTLVEMLRVIIVYFEHNVTRVVCATDR